MHSNQGLIVHFYLFINRVSGGGWGARYLTLGSKTRTYLLDDMKCITVNLVDIFNHQAMEQAVQCIKRWHDAKEQVRVVICGGDGTVLSVIQRLRDDQVSISDTIFGVIPIGTGNDFSRSIGWGHSPKAFDINDTTELKNYIIDWMEAGVSKYDVWDVSVQVYEHGSICVLKDKQEVRLNSKKLEKCFSNYTGIGIDAKASYRFQKYRSPFKVVNLVIYFCLGFCGFFQRMKKLNQKIETFTQEDLANEEILQTTITPRAPLQAYEEPIGPKYDKAGEIRFRDSYRGLVCLNATSYMAGMRKCWFTKHLGSTGVKSEFASQRIDDGMVEFVGYRNYFWLGMERFMRGGSKITQGSGPFTISFKDDHENILSTYLQIDGEGYKLYGAKKMSIFKSNKIPDGYIRVMKKRIKTNEM